MHDFNGKCARNWGRTFTDTRTFNKMHPQIIQMLKEAKPDSETATSAPWRVLASYKLPKSLLGHWCILLNQDSHHGIHPEELLQSDQERIRPLT